MTQIAQINDRGGLTLPKKIRALFPGLDVVIVKAEKRSIVLEPLQTRDEFILELERRSRAAETGKRYSLDEVDEILKKRTHPPLDTGSR
jgi:bifunctional DNA-binding transcriptional regulator/antitoxin component of YhaV-PrlF toxin-antitoxin module